MLRPRAIALTAAVLAVVACRGDRDARPSAGPASLPIRAVDRFGIDEAIGTGSPLGAPPAVAALFAETFEDSRLPGWKPVGTASSVRLVDHSLEVASDPGSTRALPQVHRRLAVQPDTLYRLTGAVRTAGLEPQGRESAGASLEVLEWGDPGQAPLAYHAHLPRERGTSRDWRRIDYRFRTTPDTRQVTVALVAAHGAASGRAFFDDVALAESSEIEALRLGEPYVSLARPAPHERVRQVEIGGDVRPGILADAGSDWTWNVELPSGGAVLRLGLAAVAGGSEPGELCFEVSTAGSKLHESCRPATAAAGQRWEEVAIRLEGGAQRLMFGVRSGAGRGVWGNPRIAPASASAGERPPDVVLIVFDTLRADHVGAEGYTRRPTTPNLDGVARAGIRYANAFAPSAWTTTSLGSLMTSRYPSQHGAGLRIPREIEFSDVLTPPGRRASGHSGLAPAEITLAQRLAAAGYETVGFHRNLLFGPQLGFARGFDRFDYYSGEDLAGGVEGAERAIDWLRERRAAGDATPFFLVFHLMDPHLPFHMRREYYAEFGPPLLPRGYALDPAQPFVSFQSWERQRPQNAADMDKVLAMYDSDIAHADRAAGMVLNDLAQGEEPVVIALSDHGEGFGEHGLYEHGNSMYDELLRVPLYVRLPGGKGAGTVAETAVSLIDVAPSILHLAGLPNPQGMEGAVLPGLGLAAGASSRPRRGLIAEATFLGPDQTALLLDGLKYVYTHPGGHLGFQDGGPAERRSGRQRPMKEELYSLVDDPREERDLIAARISEAAAMREIVRGYLEQHAHGLHVRCGGQASGRLSHALGIESSSTIAEVKPLGMHPVDLLSVAPSRKRVDLLLDTTPEASEDWLVLRTLDRGAELRVEARSQPSCTPALYLGLRDEPVSSPAVVRLGDPANLGPPGVPASTAACWCQLWEVPSPLEAGTEALDEEALQQLRALGYMN